MTERAGLWVGAEVRYVGPEREGPLRPGVVGSVAETTAGRSTGFLSGRRPKLRRDEVLVVLTDGQAVTARIEDLQVTTPLHALRPESDAGQARWLLDALRPWTSGDRTLPVASFVPDTFPEVVKILHPWAADQASEPVVSWAHVAEGARLRSLQALSDTRPRGGPVEVEGWQPPEQGRMDHRTAAALVEVLQGQTSTPEDVFVGVWTGWGGFPYERFAGAAVLPTEARGHRLLRGPLDGVLELVSERPFHLETSGIWWPSDRAWVVASEVDFEWTFVAGPEALVAQLAQHGALEVLRTDMDAPANRLDQDLPV